MTRNQFLQLADLLPEAMFLVSGDGAILAANRCAGQRLRTQSGELVGRRMGEFVAESPAALSDYLLTCSRTRSAMPGSLTLACPGNEPVPCRAEGGVIQPRTELEAPQVLLRLIPKSESPTRFAILTRRIEELNREIAAGKVDYRPFG